MQPTILLIAITCVSFQGVDACEEAVEAANQIVKRAVGGLDGVPTIKLDVSLDEKNENLRWATGSVELNNAESFDLLAEITADEDQNWHLQWIKIDGHRIYEKRNGKDWTPNSGFIVFIPIPYQDRISSYEAALVRQRISLQQLEELSVRRGDRLTELIETHRNRLSDLESDIEYLKKLQEKNSNRFP